MSPKNDETPLFPGYLTTLALGRREGSHRPCLLSSSRKWQGLFSYGNQVTCICDGTSHNGLRVTESQSHWVTVSQCHRHPRVLSIRVGEIFLCLISLNYFTPFARRGTLQAWVFLAGTIIILCITNWMGPQASMRPIQPLLLKLSSSINCCMFSAAKIMQLYLSC